METRALVPIKKTRPTYQKEQEPFELFISLIMQKIQMKNKTSMAGSAHWSDLPVDKVLADGLWVILLRVAKELQCELTTNVQVDMVSKRVSRVLVTGLMIQYGSMEKAAHAFYEKVLGPVQRALILGLCANIAVDVPTWKQYLSGNDNVLKNTFLYKSDNLITPYMSNLWQIPCALFFGECLRAASEHKKCIEVEIHALKQHPHIHNTLIISLAFLSKYESMVQYLDLHVDTETFQQNLNKENFSTTLFDISDLQNAIKDLRHFHFRQMVLSYLPAYIAKIPADCHFDDYSTIENEWIRTQLLLAAGDIEDRDYIVSSEYVTALEKLKKLSTQKIFKIFCERMIKRGMNLPVQMKPELYQAVANAYHELTRLHSAFSDESALNVIIRVVPTDVVIRPETALLMARGEAPVLWASLDDEKYISIIENSLIPAIEWCMLSFEDMMAILNAQVLFPDYIFDDDSRLITMGKMTEKMVVQNDRLRNAFLRVLVLLNKDVAKNIALYFLEQNKMSEKIMTVLVENDLVDIDKNIFIQYTNCIPVGFIKKYLANFLLSLKFNNVDDNQPPLLNAFIKATNRLPADDVASILSAQNVRKNLVEIIHQTIYYSTVKKTSSEIFRQKIGVRLWNYCILANIIARTSYDYSHDAWIDDDIKTGEDPEVLSWEKLIEDCFSFLQHSTKNETVAALAEQYKEKDIFYWYYEGNTRVEKLYQKYCQDREKIIEKIKKKKKRDLLDYRPSKRSKKKGKT